MSLLVVTVNDSANAENGAARIDNKDSATIIFLFVNELATVYNLFYHLLLSVAIISGMLGTAVPPAFGLKMPGCGGRAPQTGLKGMLPAS